jgi:hypothetical protein
VVSSPLACPCPNWYRHSAQSSSASSVAMFPKFNIAEFVFAVNLNEKAPRKKGRECVGTDKVVVERDQRQVWCHCPITLSPLASTISGLCRILYASKTQFMVPMKDIYEISKNSFYMKITQLYIDSQECYVALRMLHRF